MLRTCALFFQLSLISIGTLHAFVCLMHCWEPPWRTSAKSWAQRSSTAGRNQSQRSPSSSPSLLPICNIRLAFSVQLIAPGTCWAGRMMASLLVLFRLPISCSLCGLQLSIVSALQLYVHLVFVKAPICLHGCLVARTGPYLRTCSRTWPYWGTFAASTALPCIRLVCCRQRSKSRNICLLLNMCCPAFLQTLRFRAALTCLRHWWLTAILGQPVLQFNPRQRLVPLHWTYSLFIGC